METKEQLMVTALTQRIGELTSAYEQRLAEIRADATLQITQLKEEIRRLNEALGLRQDERIPPTADETS